MTALILHAGPIVAIAIAAVIFWRWWHGVIASGLGAVVWLLGGGSPYGEPWIPGALAFVVLLSVFTVVYGAKRLILWGIQSWPRAAALTFVAVIGGAVFLAILALIARRYEPGSVPEFVHRMADLEATCLSQQLPIPVLPSFDGPEPTERPVLTEVPAVYANVPIVKEVWRNFLGPEISIRTPDAAKYADIFPGHVTLTVVVDESGNVAATMPTGGPREFYEQAARIARQWKFEPFVRDGKPSVVRLEGSVSIKTRERRTSGEMLFPTIKDWSSLRIRVFHRIHGFGGVDYDLTIRGDGIVQYEGRWGVALTGRHCAAISREVLERLVREFERAQFFTLDDHYVAQGSDLNSVDLSISFDGHTKGVHDYGAEFLIDAPDAVLALPTFTDRAVQSRRWVVGNKYTVPSLKAENWDFSQLRTTHRGLLSRVATFGDPDAVRALLEAGADPYAVDEFSGAPLERARDREDGAEIVAILEQWMAAHPERRQ